MRSFKHIDARTVDEACTLLREYKGKAMLNASWPNLRTRYCIRLKNAGISNR